MKQLRQILLTYTMLTVGGFIGSLGVVIFLAPNSIAPTGVTGISIISNFLFRHTDWRDGLSLEYSNSATGCADVARWLA